MNPDPTLDTILKDTYSTVQLKRRLRALKDKLLQDFFGGTKEAQKPSSADQLWLDSLPPEFFKAFSKDSVYKIFEDLEKKVQGLPTLIIYIPLELPEAALDEIGNRVRKMFGSLFLIESKINPDLIAGCALGWKGVIRDYSLKSQIEARKGEILEAFRKFLVQKNYESN